MVIIVLRKILIFSIGLGRGPRQMDMAVLPAQEDQGIMTKYVTFLTECINSIHVLTFLTYTVKTSEQRTLWGQAICPL